MLVNNVKSRRSTFQLGIFIHRLLGATLSFLRRLFQRPSPLPRVLGVLGDSVLDALMDFCSLIFTLLAHLLGDEIFLLFAFPEGGTLELFRNLFCNFFSKLFGKTFKLKLFSKVEDKVFKLIRKNVTCFLESIKTIWAIFGREFKHRHSTCFLGGLVIPGGRVASFGFSRHLSPCRFLSSRGVIGYDFLDAQKEIIVRFVALCTVRMSSSIDGVARKERDGGNLNELHC
mmetsp:Transcript_12706/g.21632  ORF Transcript_12706/g.21632 Transcript_12706/m.21632 type:complete len:229 (-) Transcript_12706:91-777(-)